MIDDDTYTISFYAIIHCSNTLSNIESEHYVLWYYTYDADYKM